MESESKTLNGLFDTFTPNIIYKWNFEKHEYEEIINTWGISLIHELGEMTICANCKEPLLFDNGYTSNQWHSKVGFGYSVCEKCFEAEKMMEKSFKEGE